MGATTQCQFCILSLHRCHGQHAATSIALSARASCHMTMCMDGATDCVPPLHHPKHPAGCDRRGIHIGANRPTPLIHIGPRSEDEESRGPDDARHGTDDRNLPYTTMCQLCLRACARVCMCGHGIGRGTTTTSESAATLILSVVSG